MGTALGARLTGGYHREIGAAHDAAHCLLVGGRRGGSDSGGAEEGEQAARAGASDEDGELIGHCGDGLKYSVSQLRVGEGIG